MSSIADLIDHTLLKPNATADQIRTVAREAAEIRAASVCVNGAWVATAASATGGEVPVCSVIGFDLGAMHPAAKAFETGQARADGASEIDMVINIGLALAGEWAALQSEIEAVVGAAEGGLVKVIIESATLTDAQIVAACEASVAAGAGFVKTSTGFHPDGGASLEAVALMAETVGPDIGVKASGGIRDLETADAMIAAGATRLGMSASLAVVEADRARRGEG